MEAIHHYTDIHSLAQILDKKTLRFTRLDQVDDVLEAKAIGRSIGSFFFVSCWTHAQRESIPQWKMYTSDMAGVRISFHANVFKDHVVYLPSYLAGLCSNPSPAIACSNELFTDQYIIIPNLPTAGARGYKVNYVDDIQNVYANIWKQFDTEKAGIKNAEIDFSEVALKKSSDWAFQDEYRFVLMVAPPFHERLHLEHFQNATLQDWVNTFLNRLNRGPFFPFTNIDLSIDPESLNSMVVTIGPAANEGTRIMIESLLDKYAPKATVRQSSLRNKIRLT